MAIADYWEEQYNNHADDPDAIVFRMTQDLSDSVRLVWENTNIELFLFKDDTMLVIPEGESAHMVRWEKWI